MGNKKATQFGGSPNVKSRIIPSQIVENINDMDKNLFYNNGVTTMSLQEIVEATVANHFIDDQVVEGIV